MCPRCLFGDVLSAVDDGGPTTITPNIAAGPKRLGEYELLEELGRGGMGVVWKARQGRLNRVVALKLVRGGCLPGESAAKRFRREAEAVAQLKHPNIVTIHEVGEFDEQLYLSMDFIEGGSLSDWLKRVAFSPRDAAALVAKVARGVHHAHEQQVLHRDLKPGNILLDVAGEPHVCDFGLARLGDTESSLTVSGELLGTPAYLSPEQAAGKTRDLTPASDTYSLGAILYELLCGRPPFSADNLPALLRKVAEDDPMRPISHYSGGRIPFDLSTICLKCLQKEPHARYSSALALAEDLERWLRGEPILARPVARAERVWKWVRRKPVLAALWLVVTMLLIVVAAVASVMGLRLATERKAVVELHETARHQVARQHSDTAQHYIADGDYLRALPGLAEAIRIGSGDPRLDEADRIRFGVLLRNSPQLAHAWFSGKPVTRAEATIDGTRFVAATENTAEVWNTQTGVRIGNEITLDDIISNLQFDNVTGRWVLFALARGRLVVWEPDTGHVRDVGEGSIYAHPEGSYLQSGTNFIAYTGDTAEVRSVATGERVAGPFKHEHTVRWAIILPNISRALSTDTDGIVYMWDIAKNQPAHHPIVFSSTKKAPLNFGAYRPEKKEAALYRDNNCWVVNCETGESVHYRVGVTDSVQTIGWERFRDWLFLGRNNDGVTLRKLEDDSIRWSWHHRALGFRGHFAPDQGLVATQSWNGSARVWRISNGRPVSPHVWQTATPGSCLLDQQGRWLLTRGDEPAARLWMLRSESGLSIFPDSDPNPRTMWLSGDGKKFIVADEAGGITTWDAELPKERIGAAQHPESIRWAGPIAKGRRFFTAGVGKVQVWDTATLKPVGSPLSSDIVIRYVTGDANGETLAVVLNNGDVSIYGIDGSLKSKLAVAAQTVSFSPDGKMLLVMSENAGSTWDAQTGRPISQPFEQPGGSLQGRFSPDGQFVVQWSAVSSSGPFRAQVWEAATGKVKSRLPTHWLGVSDAVWSPDGKSIATGGFDQTVHIADAETGSPLLQPLKHPQKVVSVGFSRDGMLLWSLAEKEITVWHTVTGEPLTPRLRHVPRPIAIVMGHDDRSVAVIGRRAAPWIWNLQPDLRSPDELRSIAHVLSSHALMAGTGALRPLSLVELRSAWERARKSLGSW